MNLNPVALERRVAQGSETTIEVRLYNLESIDSQNVDVEYFVKDMNGNTIVTESETVVVKTQASFFKTISIPKNLKPGPYIFAAQSKFGNSVGTASYLFEVEGPEKLSFLQFCKNNVLCLGLSLATILLLFALVAYFYFFIGAYLYEKMTGIATIPAKATRKEETVEQREEAAEEPEAPGLFKKMMLKARAWSKNWKKRQRSKEISYRRLEIERIAEERRVQLESGKKQEEEKKKRDIEEKRRLEEAVEKERETLERENNRAELRKIKWQEALENEKRKAELKRLREHERKKRKLERQKLLREKKKQALELFHKLGLYKTPEERKQIELQREKEKLEKEKQRQEEIRRREEGRKKTEAQKQEELEQKGQSELKIQQELEKKKEKATNKNKIRLERARTINQTKKQVKEFFHKLGLYKTPEEKRKIEL